MKKKIKIFLSITLFVVLVFSFFIVITIHPELLIKNKIQQNNYTVYSTQPIDKDIFNILDSIEHIVSKCEIYQPNVKHRIFFCYGNRFFKTIQKKMIKSSTLPPMYTQGNSKIQNIITFRPVDIKNNRLILEEKKKPNLTQVIAHEIIHTFQNRIYGDPKNIPFWKKEAYAEYWSDLNKDKTTPDLINSKIELLEKQDLSWMKDGSGNYVPFNFGLVNKSYFKDSIGNLYAGLYYVSHLMAQYVFDIKKMDYDKFMAKETNQNDILNEMFKWSNNYAKPQL